MRLNITTDFPDVARRIRNLEQGIADKATARALNRTAEQAKTAMSREIRAEYNIGAAKVNQSLRVQRARATGGAFSLQAALESPAKRGRSLNLAAFGARQTRRGVSFRVRKSTGRVVIPGSFLINQGKTVMIRTGEKRLPIKALQTIDVAQMFNAQRINAKVVQVIRDRFPTIFAREVKFYTSRV